MANVPNTNNFSLQDVYNSVSSHDATVQDDLVSCFDKSVASYFDSNYGSKTMNPKTLYGFRNYTPVTITVTTGLPEILVYPAPSNNITFNATASYGGATIIERGFCWSTSNEEPTIADSGQVYTGGGTTSFSQVFINSFSSQTNYYFRAYIIDNNNVVYYGNINILNFVKIGDSYQGGKVAYVYLPGDTGFTNATEQHGLIAQASDLSEGIVWTVGDLVVTNATGVDLTTGGTNTDLIYQAQGFFNYAASLCADSVVGGYTDWVLPSVNELSKLLDSKTAIGGFNGADYWSSTEYDIDSAYARVTSSNNFWIAPKYNSTNNVRAIRYF